jgi:RNA polymerase sigma factor (sigma-70 family)
MCRTLSKPHDAAEQLWDYFLSLHPNLFQMLSRMRFNEADAADAVQEALMRARMWIDTGRSLEIKNPAKWLSSVAIKAALTLLGKWNSCALCFDPACCPFEEFDRLEEQTVQLAAIKEAVERLPHQLRILFTFCKLDGHTIAETAIRFNLPLGTVNARLLRARDAIRKALHVEQINDCDEKVD